MSRTAPGTKLTTKGRRPAGLPTGSGVFVSVLVVCASHGQTATLRVNVELRTGGALNGLVVDHTGHGLVLMHDRTPYVFSWNELETDNACAIKRTLRALERGGESGLTAEDHIELGAYALSRDRRDLATRAFREAERLDNACGARADDLLRTHRAETVAARKERQQRADVALGGSSFWDAAAAPAERRVADLGLPSAPRLAPKPTPEESDMVLNAYRTFGAKVAEVLGRAVVGIESEHFLIWTDWNRRHHDRLIRRCESMYSALCDQFDLDPLADVFLAKCPVFCFRSKSRFQHFARYFDGYDGVGAAGYTRSIESNGHVHVALLRTGGTELDFDRFACTLVHEGTHAFLHRLFSSKLIPHWINEGFADLMAERILADRCPAGENAELLARQFVRYGWSVLELLRSTGPIEVHEYPVAHSVIAHLAARGRSRFAGFIEDLKEGKTTVEALAARYDGLTLEQLDADWRSAIRAGDPVAGPATAREVPSHGTRGP